MFGWARVMHYVECGIVSVWSSELGELVVS